MAVTTIYARRDFATSRPDSPPRSAPGACQKLPGPWWYWALLGSGWVGTVALVGVVLWLLQQHAGSSSQAISPLGKRRGAASTSPWTRTGGFMWFWSLVQALFSTLTAAAKTPGVTPAALCSIPATSLGSRHSSTMLRVKPILILGGNNPIPSQDAEVLGSGCSWESCWTNSTQRATPEFKCSLSCFRLQLRQRLCEEQNQHPTGPSACRLCPAGWQPFAAKCYRISTKTESWEKAAKDCLDQRSQLVKLESAEEKVFIGNMTKIISAAWLGLSITWARGKEWTWWDGSPLQETLFKMPDHGEGDACATIQRGELNPHSCTTPLHWICQKEATEV